MNKLIQYLFLLLIINICSANENNNHLYISWQGSEADKAASTWLIKRYDTLINEYNITNITAIELGKVIHEIEINTWRINQNEKNNLIYKQWLLVQKKYISQTPPLTCILDYYDLIFERIKNNASLELTNKQLISICKI